MKVISITGTKGKTSLVFLLDNILRLQGANVFCVSSEGTFLNGKNIKDNSYFIEKYHTSANVAAIKEIKAEDLKNVDYVLLESSYANNVNISNSFMGGNIDIGILSNVYSDHVDGKKVKNRQELLLRKVSILQNIKKNGKALIFAGDKHGSISYKAKEILTNKRSDIAIFSYAGDRIKDKSEDCYHLDKGFILRGKNKLISLSSIPMPFKDVHRPTVANLVAITGLLDMLNLDVHCLADAKICNGIAPGRLNLFSKGDKNIMLDYAHEQKSLQQVSQMLRKQFAKQKIVAVVRLSYYRNRKNLKILSKCLAKLFDSYIIYDKAISQSSLRDAFTYDKKIGEVAELMYDIISETGKNTVRIDDEFEAISYGIKKLKKNEVLYIMGNQIDKDIKLIKSVAGLR